jgi:hypothetical protein
MTTGAPVREARPTERRGHPAGDDHGPLDYARRWRFELVPAEIATQPSITLRPAAAMPGRMRSVA